MALLVVLSVTALSVGGCDSRYGEPVELPTTGDLLHPPNHGGVMVQFGKEFAHLEFVHDPSAGSLTAHATDSDGVTSLRLSQDRLPIEVHFGSDGGKIDLELLPVANPATGEVAGDSCTFTVSHERLRGATWFEGVVNAVILHDRHFKTVAFKIDHKAPTKNSD